MIKGGLWDAGIYQGIWFIYCDSLQNTLFLRVDN